MLGFTLKRWWLFEKIVLGDEAGDLANFKCPNYPIFHGPQIL